VETKSPATILIVDDEPGILEVTAEALADSGYELLLAGDSQSALALLRDHEVDLLLTDIVMPGMDGIELAKRAAERNGALKIMFITGFAAVALHPASGAPKQAKVLSKPFHLREIVVEVDRMLAAA
jgi:two-component system, cell cycle response regulator CpdR